MWEKILETKKFNREKKFKRKICERKIAPFYTHYAERTIVKESLNLFIFRWHKL